MANATCFIKVCRRTLSGGADAGGFFVLITYTRMYIAELVSAAVCWLPVLAVLGIIFRRKVSRVRMAYGFLFAAYLTLVLSIVGFPQINVLTLDVSCNFIPFADIATEGKRYVILSSLNILLFVPLGVLVPLLWKEFRSLKRMAILGGALSLFIEVMQLFTFRATDVDDLIMNTLGAVLGYLLMSRLILRQGRLKPETWDGALWELPVISVLVLMSVFFAQSYVMELLF